MRPRSRHIIIGVAILLGHFMAGEAAAQECPVLEVVCSDRMAGDSAPLHCTANVEGDTSSMKLTYQWSISPQAPIRNIPGRPDEIELELSSVQNQPVKITLTVKGLSEDCPDTAEFDSLPIRRDEPEREPPPMERLPPNTSSNTRSITGTCSEVVREGVPAYFSVSLSEVEQGAKPIFNWTLSRGKIRSGQGTSSILVDTTDLGGEIITATAQVNGLSTALKVSCATMIRRIPKAYKLDEIIKKDAGEEGERLRRFALRLNIGLDEQAYIVVIAKRGQSIKEAKKRGERVRDELVETYNVAPARIMGVGVGFGNEEAIQLWVIQNGASPPETPIAVR